MTTGKGRIKIEEVLLIFQENVAIMGIPVPNNGHHLTRRIEYDPGSFDQLTQSWLAFFPNNDLPMAIIDRPMIFEQVLESNTIIYIWSILIWSTLTWSTLTWNTL